MRELGESKQTVAAVQSKVPFVSYPRIVMKAYMGVMQIDRLLSSLLSLCAQVGELEKENQGLRATLELARTANTHWSVSSGKQDKALQCQQAEIEKLKVDLAKVRCCVSFSSDSTLTPTPASIVSSDIFAEIRNRRSCKPSVLRNVSGPGLAFSRSPLCQHIANRQMPSRAAPGASQRHDREPLRM